MEQQTSRVMEKKGYKEPNDPHWSKQWYLVSIIIIQASTVCYYFVIGIASSYGHWELYTTIVNLQLLSLRSTVRLEYCRS